MKKTCLVAVLLLSITGCANLNSIFRKTDTEEGRAETILIDAKQRPITVNRVTDRSQPITCLARSADALSQAAASGNLKITQPSGSGGEAGFATAEQVSSIAFRTQVTEAQQEFLYYLCQLQANGVLKNGEVADNLRHFQNTMLAMVAIDDLAGAARPKSAATPASSGDTTPPPAPDKSDPKVQAVEVAQSAVGSAQQGVKSASTKLDTAAKAVVAVKDPKDLDKTAKDLTDALTAYDKKQQTYATALTTLNTKVKALKGKDAKAPDAVTSATSDTASALKDVKTDYSKVTDAISTLKKVTDAGKLKDPQDALSKALGDYKTAVGTYEDKEDALGTALTAWSEATDDSSKGKNANAKDGTGDSGGSAVSPTVANDVAIIVQTIVWQSFISEQCQKALFENYEKTAEVMQVFCLQHLMKADEVREKQLLGTLTVPTSNRSNTPPPSATQTSGPATPIQPFMTIDVLRDFVAQSTQQRVKAAAAEAAAARAADAQDQAAPAQQPHK